MRHGGSVSTTPGTSWTVRTASWHFEPSKWRQPRPAQGAAKRNTSVGFTGSDRANSSSVTGRGSTRCSSRGSSTVPPTTPKITLPAISGWALGHSGEVSGVIPSSMRNSKSVSHDLYSSPAGPLASWRIFRSCSARADHLTWLPDVAPRIEPDPINDRAERNLLGLQRAQNRAKHSFREVIDADAGIGWQLSLERRTRRAGERFRRIVRRASTHGMILHITKRILDSRISVG